MPYDRFEQSFAGFLGYVENLGNTKLETAEQSKSDEIRNKLNHVDKQIAKLKAAFEEIDPSKAVSLATMLTDYDTQRAQLVKDLDAAIIKEKGETPLTKGHFDYLKRLFGKENKLQDPATRLEIQEALRTAIDRITIDVATQSYKVTWRNSPNVFEVQLRKDGFDVKGDGCTHISLTDF